MKGFSLEELREPKKLTGNRLKAYEYVKAEEKRTNKKWKLTKIRGKANRFLKFLDWSDEDQSTGTYIPAEAQTPDKTEGTVKGVSVVPIDASRYILKSTPFYKPIKNEHLIFDAHADSQVPLLLVGPKGTGKTLSIANWASKKKFCFIQYDCSEGTKEANLVGRYTMSSGGYTPFKLGIIPTIVECANQCGVAVLVLEEMNALTPAMQKQLNPLLDWRKGIFVEATGQYYKLKKGAKLIVFATMNPSSYGAAANDLNEDLMSRFAIWQWNYAPIAMEKKIINTKGIDPKTVKHIFNLAKESRAMARKEEIEYAISPRDIDLLCTQLRSYKKIKGLDALQTALEVIVLGKYEVASQKAQMKSRIESIFGTTMDIEPEEKEVTA